MSERYYRLPVTNKATLEEFRRRRYALIRPESKVWIGWFNSWVHAFTHLRKRCVDRERWFIVRNKSGRVAKGWLRVDTPCKMRKGSSNGFYGERGTMARTHRTQPPAGKWTKRRYGKRQGKLDVR